MENNHLAVEQKHLLRLKPMHIVALERDRLTGDHVCQVTDFGADFFTDSIIQSSSGKATGLLSRSPMARGRSCTLVRINVASSATFSTSSPHRRSRFWAMPS